MLRLCSWFALILALALPVHAAEIVGPVRVIDGDTLNVGTTRIRLYGIDAPERDQPCVTEQGTVYPCGSWVTTQVRQRFEGMTATCTQVDVDRYNRIVARCSIDGLDIGRALVAEGLAFAFRRYSLDYDLEEKQAYVAERGLHAFVLQSPEQHRRSPPAARVSASASCVIKGNISANGKIYHMPGQDHYGKTVIDETRGERLFCTEAEALAEGWRAARR